jgi:phenylalanyl-tRNA synthetase alpha subunit
MGQSSEFEHRKKLNKIREDMNKRVKDVRDQFAKMENVKLDALKKTEEMKRSAQQDIAKLETDITKSDLASDLKQALSSDIDILRKEIEERASELRTRIVGTAIPS